MSLARDRIERAERFVTIGRCHLVIASTIRNREWSTQDVLHYHGLAGWHGAVRGRNLEAGVRFEDVIVLR
jgi:hypothetical protein